MLVYRIARATYAQDFSGEGARLYGGRWNHKGTRVIYTSAHISLAFLELLVNADHWQLEGQFKLITFSVPEEIVIETVDRDGLPGDWRSAPESAETRDTGTSWVQRAGSVILSVPSAVIPAEKNYLLNPQHRDFERIHPVRVDDFDVDARFLAR